MAENIYLKIDPIKGNSEDDAHIDWNEVLSFECYIEHESMQTPEANFGFLVVDKVIDAGTPDLLQRCANGDRIDKLELEVCRLTADENVVVFKYELEGVRVVSVRPNAGSPSDQTENLPSEIVKFAYNKIICTVIPVDRGGKAGSTAGPKGWDVRTNKSA